MNDPTRFRAPKVILLVEDEDAIRILVRGILESRGFVVLEAGDGREGLSRYEAHLHSIDLLLTDVMMPELDGCELATRALKLRPHLRVLLMSGSCGHVGLDQQIGKGAAFLEKPFTTVGLIDKVRDTLSIAV